MGIFHDFSRTFFVHENSSLVNFCGHIWVNSSGNSLMVITDSADTVVHSTRGVGAKPLLS